MGVKLHNFDNKKPRPVPKNKKTVKNTKAVFKKPDKNYITVSAILNY